MINLVVYTVVMKHIWCVILHVRCVLVECWNSPIVQLAKFMWKSTTPLAVLLVLDDQFCNSYCWTVYWEMSTVDEVTWVYIGRWNYRMREDERFLNEWQQDVPTHTKFLLLYSRIHLIWHLWDQAGSELSCSTYIDLTSLKVIFCYCSFPRLHN